MGAAFAAAVATTGTAAAGAGAGAGLDEFCGAVGGVAGEAAAPAPAGSMTKISCPIFT